MNMMNKNQLIAVCIFLAASISGCTTISDTEVARTSNHLSKSQRSSSELFNNSYKDVFIAVLSVFRDLGIEIIDKDFDNKRITGIVSSSQGFLSYEGGAMRYLVEFSTIDKGTTVTLRLLSGIKYHYDENFILPLIKKELELQEKLK